jgi:hypothetical protein
MGSLLVFFKGKMYFYLAGIFIEENYVELVESDVLYSSKYLP